MSLAADMTPESDRKPNMAERIAAELEENELAHEWITAAEVAIDAKTARRAAFRGSFRTEEGMRIDALEVYCRRCRRPQDEVADQDCAAKIDNTHLIGGDPGVRAKRIHHKPIGKVIKTGPVDRRGLAGFSVHAGK